MNIPVINTTVNSRDEKKICNYQKRKKKKRKTLIKNLKNRNGAKTTQSGFPFIRP